MNKIEEIEKLLEGWKAAGQKAKEELFGTEELFMQGGIDFGEAALAILKESSNQVVTTDASPCSCASDQGAPCSACMEAKYNL